MRTQPLGFAPAPLDRPHGQPARPRQTFLQVLEEGGARRREGTRDASQVTPPAAASVSPGAAAGSPLRTMLARTFRAEDQLDRVIASAAAGKTFSAGQLLALQAAAFRYSQTVEVLSRAADRLVGGIKQTLGTQV